MFRSLSRNADLWDARPSRLDGSRDRSIVEPMGPDEIFANPRLARIYDHLDADRRDLLAYLALVHQFGARSVLDVGCGTGTFACLLAAAGMYATLAFSVGARLREMAIRSALGEASLSLFRRVVIDGIKPGVAGAVVTARNCRGRASRSRSRGSSTCVVTATAFCE